MWNIDTNYRAEFQSTFERLNDKMAVLKKSRPLPNVDCEKLKNHFL